MSITEAAETLGTNMCTYFSRDWAVEIKGFTGLLGFHLRLHASLLGFQQFQNGMMGLRLRTSSDVV